MLGQVGDAEVASFLQQARAFGCGADAQAAGVVGVGFYFDQTAAGQSGDDAAHGGGLDLLGGGEFAQHFGAAEDQHGERGEARRAFAGGGVLLADSAQQVDGGAVQAVGYGGGGGAGEVKIPTLSHRTRQGWGTRGIFDY